MKNPEICIQTFVVTNFQQNCRVLYDPASKLAAVVDPGGGIERIISWLSTEELQLESVFLTHAHLDHGGGVRAMLDSIEQSTGKRPTFYACGEQEQFMRSTLDQQGALFGVPSREFGSVPEPDIILGDGDIFKVGSVESRVLFTPGHSPGHLALFFDVQSFAIKEPMSALNGVCESPFVLAGDTLFAGSIGRTDLPGGDHQTLIRSIQTKIISLPGNTMVLPGHGPATSVSLEKENNPFLR
jgi:glyoxylase-like metal-dependent hydrolase (beta-lactamase superfamily II)